MGSVRRSFTPDMFYCPHAASARPWLPEQGMTAPGAFQADLELLSATKLIPDTTHPNFRSVGRVRSEASGDWRIKTGESNQAEPVPPSVRSPLPSV